MKQSLKVLLSLVATLIVLILVAVLGPLVNPDLKLDNTAFMRFAFVALGLLIVYAIYLATKDNDAWKVNTREVVYMAIGAALYAIFAYLFNGTVFVVPSVSQVALRPAIVIPMFFGYAFGPVVGLFTGAVGNMFADALTGFGLSPQWCIGNGFVGMIAGMHMLFSDKKKSLNMALAAGGVLTALFALVYILKPDLENMMFFDVEAGIFGDAQITWFAGLSIVIGFILVLVVRFVAKSEDIAAAVTWAMLGNIIGMAFASISDIWINGFSFAVAIVGEFLPAAGTNLLFAAILLPIIVVAYESIQKQSGR
ncbi:MAG: ECF transporter S component [Anaerolineaceae bacterium]|nr:ECF transporter S component [Anaerolineaceae bacterium]